MPIRHILQLSACERTPSFRTGLISCYVMCRIPFLYVSRCVGHREAARVCGLVLGGVLVPQLSGRWEEEMSFSPVPTGGWGFCRIPFSPWPESPGFPSFVRSGFLTSVGRNLWFRDSERVMTISTRATSAQGALPSPEEHRQAVPGAPAAF